MNEELLKTISESLIRLRFVVGNQFVKPIKELEREKSDLSQGHIHILGWIKSRGNVPVSMTELAAKTCISRPNLTAMVDRLYTEGFVERLQDPSDRRIVNVVMTEEGINFLGRHKEAIMKFAIDRLSILDRADLEKLNAAIDDIADVIDLLGEKYGRK